MSTTPTAHEQIIALLAAFRTSTGRFPSPVAVETMERQMGGWLDARRREALHDTVPQEVYETLEAQLPDWQLTNAELWTAWAKECSNFMLETMREPDPIGTTEAERELGVWYRLQLGSASLHVLQTQRLAWMQDHCLFWAPVSLGISHATNLGGIR